MSKDGTRIGSLQREVDLRKVIAKLEAENAELLEALWKCRGIVLEMLARGGDAPNATEVAEQVRVLLARIDK